MSTRFLTTRAGRRCAAEAEAERKVNVQSIDFGELRRDLQWLRSEDGVVARAEATGVLARVLSPLFRREGREISSAENPDLGVDLYAGSAGNLASLVTIQYKHHGEGRPLGVGAVRQFIRNVVSRPYTRAMLIGRFGFTQAAHKLARQIAPISVELLDLNGIEAWIRRAEVGYPSNAPTIQLLIRSISHDFATLVAADPEALDHLEWRDLERMMARVMEGLGFVTTLTPPSKDGGKDLTLACTAEVGAETYIIELKHWRSGKRVGRRSVTDFMRVIVRERRSGGLFLSTSGYSADAFEGLTEVARSRLRLGGREKIVLLAKTYMRSCQGLWSPSESLPEVLFDSTL